MILKQVQILSLATAVALGSVAIAGDGPASQPGGARPVLKELNEETQWLCREVQSGVVRVQLPPPKWAGQPLAEQENPLNKWGNQLDPQVKQKLEQEQKDARKGQVRKISATVGAATTQAAKAATQSAVGAWTLSTS